MESKLLKEIKRQKSTLDKNFSSHSQVFMAVFANDAYLIRLRDRTLEMLNELSLDEYNFRFYSIESSASGSEFNSIKPLYNRLSQLRDAMKDLNLKFKLFDNLQGNEINDDINSFVSSFFALFDFLLDISLNYFSIGLYSKIEHYSEKRRDELQLLINEIRKRGERTADILKEIDAGRTLAEQRVNELGKLLEIGNVTALAGKFEDMAKKKKVSARTWFWVFIFSVATTFSSSILMYIYLFPNNINEYEKILHTFIKNSPLIFLVFIFYRNYTFNSRLSDEYYFKSVIGQTVGSYLELIKSEAPDSPQIGLLADAVKRMYTPPSSLRNKGEGGFIDPTDVLTNLMGRGKQQ